MSEVEQVHTRLERLRREANLSAAQMARLVGVPESTYREWENGRGMRLPPFQKISQVLAISVTELITGQTAELANVIDALVKIENAIHDLKADLSSRI